MSTLRTMFFRVFSATEWHGFTIIVKIPLILFLFLHQAPVGFVIFIEEPPGGSSSFLRIIF